MGHSGWCMAYDLGHLLLCLGGRPWAYRTGLMEIPFPFYFLLLFFLFFFHNYYLWLVSLVGK